MWGKYTQLGWKKKRPIRAEQIQRKAWDSSGLAYRGGDQVGGAKEKPLVGRKGNQKKVFLWGELPFRQPGAIF